MRTRKVIARHLHELTDILNDKGFQLQVRTQVSESKPYFINDILQHDAPSSNTHRYSFDIRRNMIFLLLLSVYIHKPQR